MVDNRPVKTSKFQQRRVQQQRFQQQRREREQRDGERKKPTDRQQQQQRRFDFRRDQQRVRGGGRSGRACCAALAQTVPHAARCSRLGGLVCVQKRAAKLHPHNSPRRPPFHFLADSKSSTRAAWTSAPSGR